MSAACSVGVLHILISTLSPIALTASEVTAFCVLMIRTISVQQLWGEKPETLRAYYNKAMEQKKSLNFQDLLKDVLD